LLHRMMWHATSANRASAMFVKKRPGLPGRSPAWEKRAGPKKPPVLSLAHYNTLRRSSTSAPMPEAISVKLANKVTGPTSGGPPLLGSAVVVAVAVAVAVDMEVAVAVAVGVAVAVAVEVAIPPP
jgi:hypothetical protein